MNFSEEAMLTYWNTISEAKRICTQTCELAWDEYKRKDEEKDEESKA
ncbi:hypothetical protein LCGC14_0370120 [marine sediment metagenome]|uniref:Uncharacterized protein n=1 Tax=marine sediment metagenome TaxID=412755 RepID=A0A0F9WE33_9ZZZZ